MGALLLVLYVVLNMVRPGPMTGTSGLIIHWLALAVGVAYLAWTAMKQPKPVQQSIPVSDGYRETLGILATTIDAADTFTRGRAYRLCQFCASVGRELGLSPSEMRDLEYAALLHDIGRTAIHYDIFYKPGKLNPEERATVKSHPKVGYEILKEIPPLARAAEIIYAHHEQPDGKGYPRGLKGKAIPMASRIIMVVAAFDAMTSDRPYRSGLSPKEAYDELRNSSGAMFFSDIVEILLSLHSSGKIFENFSKEELAKYACGEYSSRALEDYLAQRDGIEEDGTGGVESPAA